MHTKRCEKIKRLMRQTRADYVYDASTFYIDKRLIKIYSWTHSIPHECIQIHTSSLVQRNTSVINRIEINMLPIYILLSETSEMATLDVRLKKVSKIYHEGVCGANNNLIYCYAYDTTRVHVVMHRYTHSFR